MLAFVWGIKHGGEAGFLDALTVLSIAGGLGLLALFVRRQAQSRTPILDVRLFADQRFAGAVASVLFVFFGLGILLLLLTQHLQLVQGHGPLETGLRLLPLALAAGVASPCADALVRRLGARVVVGAAFAAIAAGLAAFTALDANTGYPLIAGALAAIGVGAGLAATAGSAAIMAAAPAIAPGVPQRSRRPPSSWVARSASRSWGPSRRAPTALSCRSLRRCGRWRARGCRRPHRWRRA